MTSIDMLIGMVLTEGAEGGARDHFFDETKDPNYGRPYTPPERPANEPTLPPIPFPTELVQEPDGKLYWVD